MSRLITCCLLFAVFLACLGMVVAAAPGNDKPDTKQDKKTDKKKKKSGKKKPDSGDTEDDSAFVGGRFKDLSNSSDLSGFRFFLKDPKANPKDTFWVKDGVIHVSGSPHGYFYTEKTYKNYVLRFDWKFERPADLKDDSKFMGNSGCLVHIQEPHKVWPKCVEVQGMNRDHGKIIFIGNPGTQKFDVEARNKAIKPVGEWNTTEITCLPDGTVSAKLNGVPVSSGKGELKEGHIGWQSEGAKISFCNIQIKLLK